MADLLIRDVGDDVIAGLDAHAKRLGLSRSEFLRRRLTQLSGREEPVSTRDLARFSGMFADLADPEVMRQAWS